jgi:hypothetical protein
VLKCAASAIPASTQNRPSRLRSSFSSKRRGPAAIGLSATKARPLRQNAIASAGAAAKAISGADEETARTATVSAAAVRNAGRSRDDRIFIPRHHFLQDASITVGGPQLSGK